MKERGSIHRFGGFTLIELLVVISIIAALAVTIFVALNPAKRLQDARDDRRRVDVDSILTAIHEYVIDNGSSYPSGLSAGMSEVQLGTASSGCTISSGGCATTATACVDLTTPLAKYFKSIPIDPKSGSAATTNYAVVINSDGIVTVKACGTEGGTNVSSSR